MLCPDYPTSFDQPKLEIKPVLFTPLLFPLALCLLSVSRSVVDVSAVRGCCAVHVDSWDICSILKVDPWRWHRHIVPKLMLYARFVITSVPWSIWKRNAYSVQPVFPSYQENRNIECKPTRMKTDRAGWFQIYRDWPCSDNYLSAFVIVFPQARKLRQCL